MSPEAADREAITEVLIRYAHGLDQRDWTLVESCFTVDAQAEYSGTVLQPGVQAIVDYVSGVARLDATMHFIGNVLIDLSGDTAHSECYAIANLVDGGNVKVRGLRYSDDLVRWADSWKIRKRVHRAIWMYEAASLPTKL
jgi:hypothetical protein